MQGQMAAFLLIRFEEQMASSDFPFQEQEARRFAEDAISTPGF